MPIVVYVQECIDLVNRAEITETVFISQRRPGCTPVGNIFFVSVVVMIGFVVLLVVLCSSGNDVWGRFLPNIARIEIVNPILERASRAGDYLPHCHMIFPQRVACWSRVEKILIKIPSKAPLLNWLQRHGLALLDFEDKALPIFRPGVMLRGCVLLEICHCCKAIVDGRL